MGNCEVMIDELIAGHRQLEDVLPVATQMVSDVELSVFFERCPERGEALWSRYIAYKGMKGTAGFSEFIMSYQDVPAP